MLVLPTYPLQFKKVGGLFKHMYWIMLHVRVQAEIRRGPFLPYFCVDKMLSSNMQLMMAVEGRSVGDFVICCAVIFINGLELTGHNKLKKWLCVSF
jgi:hypothetical protein